MEQFDCEASNLNSLKCDTIIIKMNQALVYIGWETRNVSRDEDTHKNESVKEC